MALNYSYTYNDRYDYNKSVEMFYIWKGYYHKNSSYEKLLLDVGMVVPNGNTKRFYQATTGIK